MQRIAKLATLAVLVAFAAAGAGCAQKAAPADPAAAPPGPAPTSAATASATPTVALPDFVSIVHKYGPAVVNVVARYDHANELPSDHPGGGQRPQPMPQIPEIFRFFGMPFGPQAQPQQSGPAESLGSGFIISEDGYILTNRHVVAHANSVRVTLPDHRSYAAKVVGEDKIYDIALLKIDAKDLPTVQIGNSNDLQAGQWVVAIGSPMGLTHSVSAGIISYVGRSLGNQDQPAVPFIQTDVPINRGNSGGPLFNLAGQVIGINSQIFSTSGGAMGLSFSIPINIAMNAEQQLRTKGYVSRGMIGATLQPITAEIARSVGLPNEAGAIVAQLQPDGPAAKGGLEVGDIITAFDGHKVESSSQLPPIVAMTAPGTDATVEVIRGRKPVTLHIKVGEMPRSGLSSELLAAAPAQAGGNLGLDVQDITPAMRRQLGYTGQGGVVVTAVKGAAAQAGLQPGDVILRVGDRPVASVAEFERDIAHAGRNGTVLLLVSHQGRNLFVAINASGK